MDKANYNILLKQARRLEDIYMTYSSSCLFIENGLSKPSVSQKLRDALMAMADQLDEIREKNEHD